MLPELALAGETVLVTGGGTGLGRAISLEFARLGAAVVIASRNPEHRSRGVAAVQEIGGTAYEVELDVRQPASVTAALDAAERLAGPVSLLVNNAAANFFAPAEQISPNGWAAVVDRVLTGTFLCSREFGSRRLKAGSQGAIVNIVSVPGLVGGPGVAHSGAAKAGVINLTRSLAAEWAPDGIRVNAIAPGTVPHGDDPPAVRAGRMGFSPGASARVPVGRVGQPREVAWLATYLCSSFAAYLTGQCIVIDGGEHLRRSIQTEPVIPVRDQLAAAAGPRGGREFGALRRRRMAFRGAGG